MKSKTLVFLNLLWLFTIVYFCFGRYAWNIPSYPLLIIYLLINFLAVNLGYFTAKDKKAPAQQLEAVEDEKTIFNRYRRTFAILCILVIIFQVSWVMTFLGRFSFAKVFETLGENYYERMAVEFKDSNSFMQIRTLCWIVTYFVYPMGFVFFKHMKLRYKLLFVTTVIVEVFSSLNMGISKNIGDLVLICIAVLFIKSSERTASVNQAKKKGLFLRISLIVVVFLVSFFFIQSMRDEAGGKAENPFGTFATVRNVSFFDVFIPGNGKLVESFDKIGHYLSHGYAGLAHALELPFKNTYGLGFSNALMEYANQYFGLPYYRALTYNNRIEALYGWKDGQWWPTAFVWYGNAISLWLVPLLMFFLGRVFKNAEYRWYNKKQITSLVMFCQLFIGFVYLSCNAQIVQGRQALIATICLTIMYFAKNVLRIKIKWR